MELNPLDVPTIQETTPAAAYALGLSPGDLRGWAVVGELPSGEFLVSSSICCTPHLMAMLSTVVAQTANGVADGTRPEHRS